MVKRNDTWLVLRERLDPLWSISQSWDLYYLAHRHNTGKPILLLFLFKVCNIFKELSVKYITSIYLASVYLSLFFLDTPLLIATDSVPCIFATSLLSESLVRTRYWCGDLQLRDRCEPCILCENQNGCHYYPAPCFNNLPVHVTVLRGTIFRYRLREQLFSQRWQTFSLHFWMLPLL